MRQSLALSVDFYETTHNLLERAWGGRKWATKFSIVAFDLFTSVGLALPGAQPWLHEEFHRATLSRRAIDSFNEVYSFTSKPGLYVSHVSDEDLVQLKRDHPHELVRAHVAGLEGEYLLVQSLERNRFYERSSGWHLPILLTSKIASFGYIWSAHLDRVTTETNHLNVIEAHDINIRDFTGHDVAAWTYDLHRPDEPYEVRGAHPGGIGIDRYIRPIDLTDAELDYVKKAAWLNLINFADPFLLWPRGFTVTNPLNDRPMQFSAKGGHLLTPFGYTIDAALFLRQDRIGIEFQWHTYVSQHQALPGFDIGLVEYPIGQSLLFSPRLAFWLQPTAQRFDAHTSQPGGLAGARIDWHLRRGWGAYVEVEAKTAGWTAGREYLDSNASVVLGATLRMR